MKFLKFYLFLTLLFSINSFATKYTAVGCPGPVTWSGFTAATCPFWNGGTQLTAQPAIGDILEIPAGCTVSVSGGVTVTNSITIICNGTLIFPGPGDHLDMATGSVINVATGGSISGPSNSNQIKIGPGGADWSGPGTSSGPFIVTAGGLPIELIEFYGKCVTNGIQLNWSTATEKDNAYFLIERSSNAIDWEFVTKVNGNGTSSSTNKYIHTDYLMTNGLVYYKMTQVDKNGESKVFQSIDVNCKDNNKDQMVLYPNPSSTELNVLLNISTPSNNNFIKIMNSFGQVVVETKVDLIKGLNTFVLPMDISSGTYSIILSSENITIPGQKLMIMK